MLIEITSKDHDVAEEHTYVLEATRLDAICRLQFLGDILGQNDVKQFLRTLLLLLDLAQVGDFAVPQPLFFQPGANPRPQEDRVEWLGDVILGSELDTMYDAFDLVQRRNHNHRQVPQKRISFHAGEYFAPVQAWHE